MDLKALWFKIKSDYRHFICIAITIIFLLLSILVFRYAMPRLIETFTDIATSCVYYVNELFELNLHGKITVNDFSKMPFEMPFNLPNTWEEFKVLWSQYWSIFFTWENVLNYFVSITDLIYYLSKVLIILLPILVIFMLIKALKKTNINNNYNQDSRFLIWWKNVFEKRIYLPVKFWIIDFIQFIKENSIYWKLWLILWLYNFNIFSIAIELIAYYLYFVASFDFVSLYTQFIKLLLDLSVMLDFIPIFIWILIILKIIDIIRRNIGYNHLNHMEMMNRGFINERPIVSMICGTMGKKKTTLLTDMALSKEIMFRDKAFELILECDLEFPNFPWINLENNIKLMMKQHKIYNLASCEMYIKHLKECFFMTIGHPEYYKSIKKHLKKHYHLPYDNVCFDYDYIRYGLDYDNKLRIIDLWDTVEDYAKLYFIYIIQSSLLVSNYSIRTDNLLQDLGNFPLWNTELFKRDTRMMDAYSRHSHIIDFDSLRLGKTLIENNHVDFEFGVGVFTEWGKERKNTLELQEVKKKDDIANQKNDLTTYKLKMIRHTATVRNYPFVWIGTDEQRPESVGADARDLFDIIYIDECSEFRLAMPLFSLGDTILRWFLSKFSNKYYQMRFERGDNPLSMYLYHNLAAKLNQYHKGIYNTFGYYKLKLQIEKGTLDGNINESYYYLMTKKIYSRRFSTDCFKEVFINRSLKNKIGLDDLIEFKSEKATFEEMLLENSYFFNDLINIKNRT